MVTTADDDYDLDDLDALQAELDGMGTSTIPVSKPSSSTAIMPGGSRPNTFVPGGAVNKNPSSNTFVPGASTNTNFPVRLTPTAPSGGREEHRPAFGTHRKVTGSPPIQPQTAQRYGSSDSNYNNPPPYSSSNQNNSFNPPANSNGFGSGVNHAAPAGFDDPNQGDWDDDDGGAWAQTNTTAANSFAANSGTNHAPIDVKPPCGIGVSPLLGVDRPNSSGLFKCKRSNRTVVCLKCEREVIYIPNYVWKSSADYIFFRTAHPCIDKLKEQADPEPGSACYACHCSWINQPDACEFIDATDLKPNVRWRCH